MFSQINRIKVKSSIIVYFIFVLPFWGGQMLYAQKLIRGPYLQQLSQNDVIIRWRTDVPTTSLVNFWKRTPNPNMPIDVKIEFDKTLTQEHILKLTNLEVNTRYFYAVGTDKIILATGKDFYFTTAPSPTDKRPINIWAMGDFGDNSTEVYIKNQTAVRDQYLKNKANYTDLWLWLGDNAYCCGTDVEYQKQIFDFYGSNILGNTAIFPSPGNHEYYETTTGQVDRKINYFDIISVPNKGEMGGVSSNTKAYYSYNYGNIHFISLDSYGLDEGKYRFYQPASTQYQWLMKDLASNTSLWTIIFFHHPPYTKRSHDSNAEEELRLTRENLVPIFDKYKVDLVLSGHSHVYERSFLIKGHTGHSMTFDPRIHVVQNVNGKYDKNIGSRPIINKDEGTVYCVVGSAGRLDWNGDTEPHPTSVYSNYTIGGSLLLTIDNNRLDARWVCADGVVRDNFSIFKNVNKIEKKTIEYGEKIRLNASWNGTQEWSNGARNQEFIEISPRKDTIITVIDSLGFLKDNFQILVSPQPIISTELRETGTICLKKELKVYFDVKNTLPEKWNYILELSDMNGSFAKPLQLDKSNKSPFSIILPDTLKESKNYRFRVRPNVDFFDEKPSKNFSVYRPVTASFIGEKAIPFDTTVTLKIRFDGTPPFSYKISKLPESVSQSLEISLKVKQTDATSYVLEKVSNTCGEGKVLEDNKVSILAPLAVEDNESNTIFRIFPNPAAEEFTIENQTGQAIKTQLILRDLNGKKVFHKSLSITEKEQISLQELPSGTYFLTLKTTTFRVSKKIVKL
ncbi:metallophosphoesterase [Emticicia sp. SJ17W-69]|uniref:metallophosphoesterase n=1 Tax=Emticicia sp. SJ17W-69 TaxID=3421657 RepID=UPI003EBB017D